MIVPQFSTCKSWLLLCVCYTFSLLGAFWCHTGLVYWYLYTLILLLFLHDTVHKGWPWNLSKRHRFWYTQQDHLQCWLWLFRLLQIPCADSELGICFLRKVCKQMQVLFRCKECTIFSVVANLSMNAKMVNDFSVQNHDLVLWWWWWWRPFRGTDCPCLLTRLLGCFLLSRRLRRILIDFISDKEKNINIVVFKDSFDLEAYWRTWRWSYRNQNK